MIALAAPHSGAVAAGMTVAAAGGNALDAALAAAAALTVTYPHQCSVGGDLVAIVRPAGGTPRAVLSIGAAAAGTDVAALRARGDRMPAGGPDTVTVPGVVAGWAAIARLGARLPLADLLAPAIALARDGVPASTGLRRAIAARRDAIRADPGLRAVLPADGEPLVQPALADTLTAIAANWRTFYKGHLAHRLVAGLRALGSPLSITDFATHRAEVVEPLSTTVDGVRWYAAPPPAQGATLLGILGSADLVTAARQAQLRRDALLGDPRTGPVDVDALMLRRTVAAAATPALARPMGDTAAVTAVGDDGTAVTLIQSVYQSFGAGILDPATGIVLHNRGSAFSLDETHPGVLRPGSRPPHTLCPALALAGDAVVALGCQGGRSQPWILAQVAADVLAAGDLPALLSRPRWVIGARDIGRTDPTLLLEPGTPGGFSATAERLGLDLATTSGPHDDAGHVQVARLRGGTLDAASDVRADGRAVVR
ncbi:gamma-glutamyltransferase [Phytohabitans rumicis]|uniref:gamma-glutamyltransferase n=1 Tax=Phytohabitans rumicis TaxID=1076125 RepID=UPI0031EBAE57